MLKLKKGDCVESRYFGPLYIIDIFRDSSGKVFVGINGVDGISYNFNASECNRKLTREEFDALPKVVRR